MYFTLYRILPNLSRTSHHLLCANHLRTARTWVVVAVVGLFNYPASEGEVHSFI